MEGQSFIKKIFICVLKMNESHTGLERHDMRASSLINDKDFNFGVN